MLKKIGTAASILFFLAFLALSLLLFGSLVPIAGGYQIRIVESGSMAPTIPLGSALIVRPVDSYTVGDVVTFQRIDDEEVTTHRIVSEEVVDGEKVFTMQGDANNTADQRPVEPREIVGKVWGHLPYVGFLLNFIRQPLGFLLLVGIPASLIVYEQVRRVIKEVRKQKIDIPETTI